MNKKLIIGFLLTSALCMTTAGAELTSENAKAYLNAINNKPYASSYLVDFDGNGTDELVIFDQDASETCEIWSGNRCIAKLDLYIPEFEQCKLMYNKYYPNNVFLVSKVSVYSKSYNYKTYTLIDGKWTIIENIQKDENCVGDVPYAWIMNINGYDIIGSVQQQESEFDKLASEIYDKYTQYRLLTDRDNTVTNQIVNAIDTSLGYKNVLSSLSLSEKTALFDDFLLPFAGYDIDYTTATDAQIAQLISDVQYDHDKFYKKLVFNINLPNYDTAMSKADADKLTSEIFGRKLDFSKLKRDKLPDMNYSNNYCYVYNNMLCFRFGGGMGGFPGEIFVKSPKLYDIGNELYYASYFEEWRCDDNSLEKIAIQNFVVRRNPDNTWRLVRSYKSNYMPTKNELESIKNPSSWAINEITSAQNENLVPNLIGLPIYKDNITRLQFAQLAVNLAENLTGQTLTTASANTFTDCNETAVLKAYFAGIINGTSQNTFSPNDFLTREQLATMLWRTAEYIQEKTNNTVLNVNSSLSGYTDANNVSSYAKNAVATLAKYGVMQGTSNTTLSPKNTCTVEQSILLTYRMFQKMI